MTLKHIAMMLCIIAFTSGITYFSMNSCTLENKSIPEWSAEKSNRVSAEIKHAFWGKLFDYELLEQRNLAPGEKVLIVWNTGAFWSSTRFLELQFLSNNTIQAKYRGFIGHPKNGKFSKKAAFTVEDTKSDKIINAINKSNFWNSSDQSVSACDGSWWIIEGLNQRKIVRWKTLIGDDSSQNAQKLGTKLFQILAEQ